LDGKLSSSAVTFVEFEVNGDPIGLAGEDEGGEGRAEKVEARRLPVFILAEKNYESF